MNYEFERMEKEQMVNDLWNLSGSTREVNEKNTHRTTCLWV
jgi:hypothetical protein